MRPTKLLIFESMSLPAAAMAFEKRGVGVAVGRGVLVGVAAGGGVLVGEEPIAVGDGDTVPPGDTEDAAVAPARAVGVERAPAVAEATAAVPIGPGVTVGVSGSGSPDSHANAPAISVIDRISNNVRVQRLNDGQ